MADTRGGFPRDCHTIVGAHIAVTPVTGKYDNGLQRQSTALCGIEGSLSGVPALGINERGWCRSCLAAWRAGATYATDGAMPTYATPVYRRKP